jgi:antitoxin CcdA
MEHMVRRKPVTLTVPEDVILAARNLELNASQAAEAGIRQAIREEMARRWLSENADAISAYNADIERRGVAIPPLWAKS